ncbi:hypothetical protein BH09ACT8_BH09ACT8_48240 [soil metagenome]
MPRPASRAADDRADVTKPTDSRPSLRTEQRALTRNRVIDAGVELFTSRPVVDVTVEDIARAAGVTRPTVYAHFPRMSDIIDAVFDELHESADDLYIELAGLDWTPDNVHGWLDRFAVRQQLNRPRVKLVNIPGLGTHQKRYIEAHRRYVEHLALGPRWDGVDPAEAEQRALMAILLIESFFNTLVAADWSLRTDDPTDLLAESVLAILRPAVVVDPTVNG